MPNFDFSKERVKNLPDLTSVFFKPLTLVELADAAVTLTSAQVIDAGMFTMTPGAGRAVTLPTALSLLAYVPCARIGTYFDFCFVNLAAQVVTITTNTGLTLVGGMTINNTSGTFRCMFTSVEQGSPTVKIFRI